ncbi:TPA: transcriptional repressor [Candidatus Gracilibacteria bacterium]|nr:transcriptional repressor [Candidatus Gracilibacteria bacterium]HIQ57113.1 transcriptional repressor [Candidatus Gracilibacteria bacterium]
MKNISEFLREKKLKKTPLRVAILEIFSSIQKPITISYLEKILHQHQFSPNQTSLYRQIETLVQHNIVQSIILKNSTAYYELQAHHHHHFICEKCHIITCLDTQDLEQTLHSVEKKLIEQGMSISSHQVSFHGKCKTCTF